MWRYRDQLSKHEDSHEKAQQAKPSGQYHWSSYTVQSNVLKDPCYNKSVFNYIHLFCRYWNKYLLNRVRHSALLLSNILNEIGLIGFYQVSMRNCLI